MKKLIALLMALALTFSMVGCGGGPDLLGKYETPLDMTDLVVAEFDSGTGMGEVLTLGDYLDSFELTLIFDFKSDGTYTQSVDQASLDAAMANMKTAMLPMLDDMMLMMFIEEFGALGYDVETIEDVEAVAQMSWADIYQTAMGSDAETFVDTLIREMSMEMMTEGLTIEGNYKAEEGKLHITQSLDEAIEEGAYETYEVGDGVVTITGGVNIIEEELLPYPYTMTKVG